MEDIDLTEYEKLKTLLENNNINYNENEEYCEREILLLNLENEPIGSVLISVNSIGGNKGCLELRGFDMNKPVGWLTAKEIFDYYIMWIKKKENNK